LEIWDAPFGGLSNELLTPQAKQLGGLSTRYFSLTIELEHDKLARRLFHRAMQLFEQINEILIEFDLDGSHDDAIVPRSRRFRTMVRTMRSDAIVRFKPQVKEHETLISGLPLRRCNHMEVIAHQQVVLRSETTMGGVLCRRSAARISVRVTVGA